VLRSDVAAFDQMGDWDDRLALESLATLYNGPFLDGFDTCE